MRKTLIILMGLLFFTTVSFGMDEVCEQLKSDPAVFVKDITGHVHEVSLRGFNATDYVVLVNGRRTNFVDLSGVDWNQISLNQIDKITVNKAGGSVLYGDNATAGVINIITKKGGARDPKEETIGSIMNLPNYLPQIDYSFYSGSYGLNTNSLGVYGAINNFDYSFNVRNKNEDGYRDNSTAKSFHYGTDLGYKFAGIDDAEIRLEFNHYDALYQLPGALTYEDIRLHGRKHTRYPNDDVDICDWFIRPLIKYKGLEVSLPFRHRNYRYRSTAWISHSETETFNPDISYTLKHEFDKDLTTTLKIGSNYQIAETKAKDTYSKAEIERKDYGFFLHDLLRWKDLELEAGIRHHRIAYDFGKEESKDSQTVWNVGGALFFDDYTPLLKQGKVFINYGTGFRFPMTDEYWSVWSGLNSNLKTQTSKTFELGTEVKINTALSPHIKVTYFNIDLKDELYYDSYNWINSNLPKTNRKGVELFVDIKPTDKIFLWGNFGWMDSEIKKYGTRIPMVPEKRITLGADFTILKDKVIDDLTLFVEWNYVGKRYFLNDLKNESCPLKAYNTINLGLSAKHKVINLTIGVDNLLNSEYSDLGVRATDSRTWSTENFYYPNQGRTFYIRGKIKF